MIIEWRRTLTYTECVKSSSSAVGEKKRCRPGRFPHRQHRRRVYQAMTLQWITLLMGKRSRALMLQPRRFPSHQHIAAAASSSSSFNSMTMMTTDSRFLRFFEGRSHYSTTEIIASSSTFVSALATLEPILISVREEVEGQVTKTRNSSHNRNGVRKSFYSSSTHDPNEDDEQKIIYGSNNKDMLPPLISRDSKLVKNKINHHNHISLQESANAAIATSVSPLSRQSPPVREGYGLTIPLTPEERDLFHLLRKVREETHLSTTLRVAGGWVRDKLLSTPEFQKSSASTATSTSGNTGNLRNKRLTSKFQMPSSMGRQGTKVIVGVATNNNQRKTMRTATAAEAIHDDEQKDDNQCRPVDIDIALDDMLGREFADHLNEFLLQQGQDSVSVGVVLKNPEKSKHLETATMKVGAFWIDFVNLRAEEYTKDSRIPDLMRIGTPAEDAFRRDLTINALFYNINTGQVEDWTGRGFEDLKRGVVATPLAPLTTLLDDPLRVLRSVRFAARLRFTMDDALVTAARDRQVRTALANKVSRERVGCEIDLMLRSPDPVGAMRLLINLNLATTVFPLETYMPLSSPSSSTGTLLSLSNHITAADIVLQKGLSLLGTTHDYLCDCRVNPPVWCDKTSSATILGVDDIMLVNDEEARRLLWYSAFLKPLCDYSKLSPLSVKQAPPPSRRKGRKSNRSIVDDLLINDLKRPVSDADMVTTILTAADDFTNLLKSGCDLAAFSILVHDIHVTFESSNPISHDDETNQNDETIPGRLHCYFEGRNIDSTTEDNKIWQEAMEFRLLCSKVLQRVGSLWRAALILSLSEQLVSLDNELEYAIEGDVVEESQEERRQGVIERYDAFAAALQQIGLIGVWREKPLLDGNAVKKLLPRIPIGPCFREVMGAQEDWITVHPGAGQELVAQYLREKFPDLM